MDSAEYQYEPLVEGGTIRYLTLDPGSGEDALSGSLVTTSIDSAKFDAISYVWGAPEKVSGISCEGRFIGITARLRDVLRRVRLLDAPRNLWADQICINQNDLVERAQQVSLMGVIYANSRTTLIWLGEAVNKQVDSVVNLLRDVDAMVKEQLQERNGLWEEMPLVTASDEIANDQRWKAIAEMTQSEWFNRVWVVQEAGLSKAPLIMYGKHDIAWDYFVSVLHWMRYRGPFIAYSFHLEWHAIHLDRKSIWHPQDKAGDNQQAPTGHSDTAVMPWSFLDILHSSRQLKATDPRDHVFAFLGHHLAASSDKSGKLIVTPDYTVDAERVCLEFATNYIKWTTDLNILPFVQHQDSNERRTGLPSWIPLWHTYPGSVLGQLGESLFDAGGEAKPRPPVLGTEDTLRVRGILFDKLQYCSVLFEERDFDWGGGTQAAETPKSTEGSKIKIVLSHILKPDTISAYPENTRLMTCAVTMIAGLHSGTRSEFESRAVAFMNCHLPESYDRKFTAGFIAGDSGLCEVEIASPLSGRKFAITEMWVYGLVPPSARAGELCCIILGAKTPFVVRPVVGNPGSHEFVGEAYIHEMMKGEVRRARELGEFEEENIVLI